jgi:hypothetical protein
MKQSSKFNKSTLLKKINYLFFFSSLLKSPTKDQNLSNSAIVKPNFLQQVTISHFEQPSQSIQSKQNPRKRCFDVDSLLAPDQPCLIKQQKCYLISSPNSKSDGSTDTDTSV